MTTRRTLFPQATSKTVHSSRPLTLLVARLTARIILGLVICLITCAAQDALASAGKRVVSLAPNITELVYALGAGERLVGRTRHCTWPPEATVLPAVGSYFRPDLERILALRPDVCLAVEDGTPPGVIDKLRSAGMQVEILRFTGTEDLPSVLHRLGILLGHTTQAAVLTERVKKLLHLPPSTSQPSVLIQIQPQPIMAAGSTSFMGKLVELAGGRVLPDITTPYPRLSAEHILQLNPDIILVADLGSGTAEHITAWRRFPTLKAVRTGRVHAVSADIFARPSLRALEALPELRALLLHDENGVGS